MTELEKSRLEIDSIDRQIVSLFERRMDVSKTIALYKSAHGMPIFDKYREQDTIDRNLAFIENPDFKPYYVEFQHDIMDISKSFQSRVMRTKGHDSRIGYIRVDLGGDSYDILIRRGCLKKASTELDLNRKVLLVTDSMVPERYYNMVLAQCREGHLFVFDSGEGSKNLETFKDILHRMLTLGFSNKDCIVAVGGGVSGDMAGFAASAYMRGIDFYNIPTTLLSQVDSSIGGKTAVNLDDFKNIIGAFKQPKKVLIDPDVLDTLPRRLVSNGLAEALKMACTFDAELFDVFFDGDPFEEIDYIIEKSLVCKKDVVEKDEREKDLRKALNFGHTIGHAIESTLLDGTLHHGECIALGMLPMCSEPVRDKLIHCYEKLGLPTTFDFDVDAVCSAIVHDKKNAGDDAIRTVHVNEIGTFEFIDMEISRIRALLSIIRS